MRSVIQRVARIREVCASPLGYAQRGLASWEVDQLLEWSQRPNLSYEDEAKLSDIERRVFAIGEARG